MIGKKATQRNSSIKRILENYNLTKDKDILRYQISDLAKINGFRADDIKVLSELQDSVRNETTLKYIFDINWALESKSPFEYFVLILN